MTLIYTKKIILIFAIVFSVAGLFVFCDSAEAQESTAISISPLTFELTANPGDFIENKIKINNPSNSIIGIRMEAEDFKAVGELGQVVVAPEEEIRYSLKRWISVDPGEFTLGPKEQKFINFTISVPLDAEPGGKYGTILASTQGVISEEKVTGASIAQKVGALMLLTVSGDTKESLEVKSFSAPEFSENAPVPFEIRFRNAGTVHVRPKGFITITDWFGKKVKDIEFPQMNVMPGTTRLIEAKWESKNMLIGKYTATLVGSYGASNEPIDPPVIVFIVFPWKIASVAAVILALIAVITYKSRKRLKLAAKILVKGHAN